MSIIARLTSIFAPKTARRHQEDEGQIQSDQMRVDARLERFIRVSQSSVKAANEFAELVSELVEDSRRGHSDGKINKRNTKG